MNADSPEALKVRKLFEERVQPIASGVVIIHGIVREPGSRIVIAVASSDPATDPVGSCVGTRGAIVKDIARELQGEHIDIVRWDGSAERFLTNLLAPMAVLKISFDEASHQATAVLQEDSELLSSKTVALRARLFRHVTGWVLQFRMES